MDEVMTEKEDIHGHVAARWLDIEAGGITNRYYFTVHPTTKFVE